MEIIKPAAAQQDGKQLLQQAMMDFRAALSAELQAEFDDIRRGTAKPSSTTVWQLTAEIDSKQSTRVSRRLGPKLQPFLDGVQQFTAIVDSFIGLGPSIAQTIWGAVKLCLLFVSNFTGYFDKLANLFRTVGDRFSVFQQYTTLYQSSVRLQNAICLYFEGIVRLCQQAIKASQKPAIIQLSKAAFRPFEVEFQPLQDKLTQAAQLVHEEIQLASAKIQVEESELNQVAQKHAGDFRQWMTRTGLVTDARMLDLQKRMEDLEARQRRRTILKIQSSLAQVDHRRIWNQIHKQGLTGTASWYRSGMQYRYWRSRPQTSVIGLFGYLGCGKSVVASNIVAETAAALAPGHALAYFFCTDGVAASRSCRAIIGSILAQLLDGSLEGMPMDDLDRLASVSVQGSLWKVIEITKHALQSKKDATIIVDGLDYCEPDEVSEVFSMLTGLLEIRDPAITRLMLVGRPSLRSQLMKHFNKATIVDVRRAVVEPDLSLFIHKMLAEKLYQGFLTLRDRTLVTGIGQYIEEGAQGMFIWAYLVIEDLCAHDSDETIIASLQDIPTTLSDLFTRIYVHAHRDTRYPYLRDLFMWAAGTCRPLRIDEMSHALSLTPGQRRMDFRKIKSDVAQATARTAGLLYLDPDDATISLVHHSFRAYLFDLTAVPQSLTNLFFDPGHVQRHLSHLCMLYLCFENFGKQLVRASDSGQQLVPQAPKITQATQRAILDVSGTARTVMRTREMLKKLPFQDSPSNTNPRSTQSVEARMGQHLMRLYEQARKSDQTAQEYALLDYVQTFWYVHAQTLHARCAERDAWRLFERLFPDSDDDGAPSSLSPRRPWTEPSHAPRPWDRRVFRGTQHVLYWSNRNRHAAVLEAQLRTLKRSRLYTAQLEADEVMATLHSTLLRDNEEENDDDATVTAEIVCRNLDGLLPSKAGKNESLLLRGILAVEHDLPEQITATLTEWTDQDGALTELTSQSTLQDYGIRISHSHVALHKLRAATARNLAHSNTTGKPPTFSTKLMQAFTTQLAADLSLLDLAIILDRPACLATLHAHCTDGSTLLRAVLVALLHDRPHAAETLLADPRGARLMTTAASTTSSTTKKSSSSATATATVLHKHALAFVPYALWRGRADLAERLACLVCASGAASRTVEGAGEVLVEALCYAFDRAAAGVFGALLRHGATRFWWEDTQNAEVVMAHMERELLRRKRRRGEREEGAGGGGDDDAAQREMRRVFGNAAERWSRKHDWLGNVSFYGGVALALWLLVQLSKVFNLAAVLAVVMCAVVAGLVLCCSSIVG